MTKMTPAAILLEELRKPRTREIAGYFLRRFVQTSIVVGAAAIFILLAWLVCNYLLFPIIGDWAVAVLVVVVLSGIVAGFITFADATY